MDPSDCSKEVWLKLRGLEVVGKTLDWHTEVAPGVVPVVVVDGEMVAGVCIACSPQELAAAIDPRDQRPKRIFLVEINALLGAVPEFAQQYARGDLISS